MQDLKDITNKLTKKNFKCDFYRFSIAKSGWKTKYGWPYLKNNSMQEKRIGSVSDLIGKKKKTTTTDRPMKNEVRIEETKKLR